MGTEMIRVGVRTNPRFMVDPGTSLCLYCLRAGNSGKGKSVSLNPAKFLDLPDPQILTPGDEVTDPPTIPADPKWDSTQNPGSGEVIADLLTVELEIDDRAGGQKRRKVRRVKDHATVWLDVDEFRGILKKGKGESSTIFDALNSAYSMRNIAISTRTRGVVVLDEPFAVYLSGGVQVKVWALLEEQDTGFLQRTVFTAVSDPWGLADINGAVMFICEPVPDGWKPPKRPPTPDGGFFTLCDEMIRDLEHDDGSAVEFCEEDDEWDTHAGLNRKRVAGLLALLFGTTIICPNIWRLAGFFMEHHRRVRAGLLAGSVEVRDKERADTGKERADIKLSEENARAEEIQGTASLILKKLEDAGGEMTVGKLSRLLHWRKSTIWPALTAMSHQSWNVVTLVFGEGRRDSILVKLV